MEDRIGNHKSNKKAENFLMNFLLPLFENEGYRYVIFSYDSSLGISYISDKNSVRRKCDWCCKPFILELAVELADICNISAKKHVNYLDGIYYEFVKKGAISEVPSKIPKKLNFIESFIEVKFNEMSTKLPDEASLFCTIFLNQYNGLSYISSIDTDGDFIYNYTFADVLKSVSKAKERGYEVIEETINEYAKALVFILTRP